MVRQATYQRDVAALTIMVKNMIDDINVFLQLHIESCILKTDFNKTWVTFENGVQRFRRRTPICGKNRITLRWCNLTSLYYQSCEIDFIFLWSSLLSITNQQIIKSIHRLSCFVTQPKQKKPEFRLGEKEGLKINR